MILLLQGELLNLEKQKEKPNGKQIELEICRENIGEKDKDGEKKNKSDAK